MKIKYRDIKDIIKDCENGKHKLVVIYSHSSHPFSTHTIRWCEICGSVVIDSDIDGRTSTGDILKMKSPKLVKIIK